MENNIYKNPYNNPYKKPETKEDTVYVSPAPVAYGTAPRFEAQPQEHQPNVTYNPTAYSKLEPQEVLLTDEQRENRKEELKKLRWTGCWLGAVLIVVFLFMRYWSIPFIYGARALGFSDTETLLLFENDIFKNVVQIILSSFCLIVPFIILTKIRGQKLSRLIPLGKPKEGTAAPFFMFGLAACSLSNIFTSYSTQFLNQILGSFGLKYSLPSSDSEKGILFFVLAVISTAVIPGLVEEFGCRGVMFGLLKEHSEGAAIIVSALIFGIMHGNFVQIPFAFIVGLALAIIRLKTGTLWIAIAVHFCNNLISVIFEHVLYVLPQSIQNIIYIGHLASSIFLGVIGILMIKRNSHKVFSLKANQNGISEKKIITTALVRPTVIIALVAYIIVAFSYISR